MPGPVPDPAAPDPAEPDAGAPPRVVRVERPRDHVVLLTLDRPEARNAVDTAVAVQLGAALAEADADPDVWCAILTGAGDRSFCAGADLKALGRGELPYDPAHPERGFAGYVSHPVSVPTIAAVNGTALGGGTELALASDLVVAAEGASFGLPEVTRGILAAAGGVMRLPQQLPRKVAMQMVLTGAPMPAAEAARWGLVNAVVPAERLLEEALDLAGRICAAAPLAVQASKRIALGIRDGAVPAEADAWALTTEEVGRIMGTADAAEGIRAFAEKRPPDWQGR